MNNVAKPRIAAIIPARYASTRFPGKPLVDLCGVTMIERVYRQASKAEKVDEVIVATDDERIAAAVERFGGRLAMTSSNHRSGTDRLAEAAGKRPDIDIIVNVQGDEPLIDPRAIDAAIAPLLEGPLVHMSTLAAPITDPGQIENPSVVKVVLDRQGFALYFSRQSIPFCRDKGSPRSCLAHTGLYVYRRECLLELAILEPTPLEIAESLEQLRALENGIGIKVVQHHYRSLAVDTPDDVSLVRNALSSSNSVSPA